VAKGLRYTEEQFREHAAKRARFQRGSEVIDTAHMVEPASAAKYNNKPTNGYASKKEARRAAELKHLLAAGSISELREQVWYLLIPKAIGEDGRVVERACSYVADFVYRDAAGRECIEDCKGMRTDAYRIKRKLMLMVHNIRILET